MGLKEDLHNCGICYELSAAFHQEFQFISTLTTVQKECIPAFLQNKDLIVQSPTGSGKTFAYALPLIQILLNAKDSWKKWECGGLVLVPNRELAVQIKNVFEKLLKEHFDLSFICWTGGNKIDEDFKKFKKFGANIIVATPGRLEALLSQCAVTDFHLAGHLRFLEVLILDEADRLLEIGFERSLTAILSSLPKQRRTGLFSATQVFEREDIQKTGVRNACRIVVNGEEYSSSTSLFGSELHKAAVVPASLKNFFKIIPGDRKFAYLISFLQFHGNEKILLFFSTCACVDYFSLFLMKYNPHGVPVLVLHGKKRRNRQMIVDEFHKLRKGIMVCTDILARGIDIPDIDWVVQFDPPKRANWFIHRSGRTGRCNKSGSSLALLTPSECGYVEFLQTNQKIMLEELQEIQEPSDVFAEEMRNKIVQWAASDRDILEKGSKAFVSYIQSYSKHDCHLVCSIRELDVAGIGNSYGLLRLPKMPELSRRDLSSFRRSDIDTSTIKYKSKSKESQRKQQRQKVTVNCAIVARTKRGKEKQQQKIKNKKRKHPTRFEEEWKELAEDARLLKRLKKGKITKEHFDEMFIHKL